LPFFSFDPLRPLKRWGRCWQVGPTCHPLWRIKVSFLDLFLTPNFWLFAFFFWSLPTSKWWGCSWQIGPTCQPLWTINVSFVGFIFYPYFRATCLFLWNVEDATVSWVPHGILSER
jgi:hypothetical protein